MPDNIVFLTVSVLLVVVLLVSIFLATRGSRTANYFLWSWAVLLLVSAPFISIRQGGISSVAAALTVLFFAVVLYLTNRHNLERLEVSHEETRRVLAESNNRIEEERRMLSRRVHDDINPNLLFCRNELQRLQKLVADNEEALDLVANVTAIIAETYKNTRELIRNTRIEVVDSIGFTAALEALIQHYSNCFDKPELAIEHNLPPRPVIPQDVTMNAYKIIREALFNAIKHSGGSKVVLSIQCDKDTNTYTAVVVDDGVGFQARSATSDGRGIGLLDMRERARVLNAAMTFEAANPGEHRPGTRVSLVFQV